MYHGELSFQLGDSDEVFEHPGLTGFPDFPSQEHFVDDRVDFVEVEDQIQLADVVEVLVEDFDEVVNGLQMGEIVVSHIRAQAEVKTRVSLGKGEE